MGCTLASFKAVILCRSLHRKVLAHPPAAVPVKGPSAKVIQLPDMKLSKNSRVNLPLYYPSRKIRK